MMKKGLFIILVTMGTLFVADAQKFGYLNSRQLLAEMPEMKTADATLQTYQKQLMTKGQNMVKALETKFQKYQQEAQSGTLSALEMQEKEAELQKEREAIQQFEIDMQNKLAVKREELYKPVLDRVKTAIEKIGKDKGYTMIFDSSVGGAILHAMESQDIIAIVKKELGL